MDYLKLFQDVRSGEFDNSKLQLIMDNDCGYWQGLTEDDDANERLENEAKQKYGEPYGYRDIVAVINAAGVNCDWC